MNKDNNFCVAIDLFVSTGGLSIYAQNEGL
jgi:hypothetical protein